MCLEPSEEIHNIMSDLEREHISALVENPFWISVDLNRDSESAGIYIGKKQTTQKIDYLNQFSQLRLGRTLRSWKPNIDSISPICFSLSRKYHEAHYQDEWAS